MNREIEEGICKTNTEEQIDERKVGASPALGEPYDIAEKVQPEAVTVKLTPQQIGGVWAVDAIKEAIEKPTEEERLLYLRSLNEMASSILALELFNRVDKTPSKNKEKVRNAVFSDIRSRISSKFSELLVEKKRGNLNLIQPKAEADVETHPGVHEVVE